MKILHLFLNYGKDKEGVKVMQNVYVRKNGPEKECEVDLTHCCLNCGISFLKGKKMKITLPAKSKGLDLMIDSVTYCPVCGSKSNYSGINGVFLCDELIVDTVLELNRKNYITDWCCSGHTIQIKEELEYTENQTQEETTLESEVNLDSYTIDLPYLTLNAYKICYTFNFNDFELNKIQRYLIKTFEDSPYGYLFRLEIDGFFTVRLQEKGPEVPEFKNLISDKFHGELFSIRDLDDGSTLWFPQFKTKQMVDSFLKFWNSKLYEIVKSLPLISDIVKVW